MTQPSDEVREVVARLIGYHFAALVSRNNMPHISGDPRMRIAAHERHRFDRACGDAADAILALPVLAGGEEEGISSDAPSLRESPRVYAEPAACYTVRNGWAWAHIFIRHGEGALHDGGPRGWVYVSVISDYGSFGYCWTHIGASPWRDFLADLDLHYAMNKMLGERFRVPLTIDEAEEQGRKTILQYRREGSLDATDARRLWDGLDDADRDGGLHSFLRSWDDCSGGRWYAHDWWDHRWDKVNPQAQGFWSEIWPHFVKQLHAEASLGSRKDGSSPQNTESPSAPGVTP